MAPPKEQQSKCSKCDKNLNKKGSVQCVICSLWFHLDCANVSDKQCSALKESVSIFFKCEDCVIPSNNPDELESTSEVRSLHSKIDRILSCMEADKKSLDAKIDSVAEEIKKEFATTFTELRNEVDNCKEVIKSVESRTAKKIMKLETENSSFIENLIDRI